MIDKNLNNFFIVKRIFSAWNSYNTGSCTIMKKDIFYVFQNNDYNFYKCVTQNNKIILIHKEDIKNNCKLITKGKK